MVTASQVFLVVKNSPDDAGDLRLRLDPWVWKIPWRRAWQPAPVFMPEVSHGQRSLVVYCSWGCKDSDMTELLIQHTKMYHFYYYYLLVPQQIN